jgi:hypothetical protein
MQQHLYKYLLLHQHLRIPALGNFVIEYQPAYYNEATELLFPRRPVIQFNEGPATAPDATLIRFLSDEMKINEAKAEKDFKNFSIGLIVLMVDQHFIDLYGIGKIKKDINGHLVFLPGSNLIDIIPPIRPGDRFLLGEKAKKIIPIATPTQHTNEPLPVLNEPKEQAQQTTDAKPVIQPIEQPKPVFKEPVVQKPIAQPKPIPKEIPKPLPKEPIKNKPIEQTKPAAKELPKKAASISINKGARIVGMNAEPDEAPSGWKSKWWIYAAGLAVAGLIALLIHIL